MTRFFCCSCLAVVALAGCGGGVPIEIHIDDVALELNMDEAMATATQEMTAAHLLPPGTSTLPELWPDTLPAVQYTLRFPTPPAPVDLTPEPGSDEAEKYSEINEAQKAIERIEINRLVLRAEQSNLTVGLPELVLQIADTKDADPTDRQAWFTIGTFAGVDEPGYVGDIELTWKLGGESLLNAQLSDDTKELALRAVANLNIDTDANPALPSGLSKLRLIVVATFFVEPTEVL